MNELLGELLLMAIVCFFVFVLNKLFPSKNNNYESTDDYDYVDNNSLFDIFDFFDSDDDDDDFDFDDD
ncbi:MAG: hypothetical protein E7263_00545 [Lachnospiraceae bacterium]|nr:hypothetical protein [Lachnospiraceae bacterium]